MERDQPKRNPSHYDGFVSDTHTTILGAVYAVRSFDLTRDNRLTGITYPQEWAPGVNMAQCFNPTRDPDYEEKRERRRAAFFYGGWPMFYLRALGSEGPFEPGPEDRAHNMKDCSCGFWGFHDAKEARSYVSNLRACGIVRMTGRAVPGTFGWRAVNAEIVALSRPWALSDYRSWQKVVDRFQVPSFNTTVDLLDAFELTKPDAWMLPTEEETNG